MIVFDVGYYHFGIDGSKCNLAIEFFDCVWIAA